MFAEYLPEVRIEQGVIDMALRGEAPGLPLGLNWLGLCQVLSIHPPRWCVFGNDLVTSPVSRNSSSVGQGCFLVVTHIDYQDSTCQDGIAGACGIAGAVFGAWQILESKREHHVTNFWSTVGGYRIMGYDDYVPLKCEFVTPSVSEGDHICR